MGDLAATGTFATPSKQDVQRMTNGADGWFYQHNWIGEADLFRNIPPKTAKPASDRENYP